MAASDDLDRESPAVQTRGRILWSQIEWAHKNLNHLATTLPQLKDTLALIAEESLELKTLTKFPDTLGVSMECWHEMALESHEAVTYWIEELDTLLTGGKGDSVQTGEEEVVLDTEVN
jgi:hypothetical protein